MEPGLQLIQMSKMGAVRLLPILLLLQLIYSEFASAPVPAAARLPTVLQRVAVTNFH